MSNTSSRFARAARRGIEWLSKGRLAKTSGQLRLPGLLSRVEVIRDQWGVPHIYAENEPDLFFTQGFVHAQDRFWQMDFERRLVAGRLSEIFGDLSVAADQWMRVLGLRAIAERETAQISGPARTAVEAYCAGVNAYLGSHRLPVEFALLRYTPEPWTVADSLSWSKMIAWMLSGNWECELLRGQLVEKLGADLARQLELQTGESWPLILDIPDVLGMREHLARQASGWTGAGPREGVGSNNWVVAGSRTRTGKPILANDMHLLLNAPAIWYENHLVGGEIEVTGVSLPGLPLVISGHNGRVAWGFTSGFADVQDLYEEHLRHQPGGAVEYEFRGEWLPAKVRREEIRVRDSASIAFDVVHTHHGAILSPLIEQETSSPLALCWTANETSGGTLSAMYAMNRAATCRAFHNALRTWGGPVLNMGYADTEGNIAYTMAGKVPIRAQGDGSVPVPGWTGEHEWTGFIPFDEMPHLYNPESGYIATANNRVAGPDYPHWLGQDFVSGDRAERITELIHARPVIDMDYIRRMQMDQISPSARDMARVMGALEVGPDLLPAVRMLREWDGHLAVDSPAAALYEVLTLQIMAVLLDHRLGALLPRYMGKILNEVVAGGTWGHHAREWLRRELQRPDSPWFDLGGGETREDVLRQALRGALDYLTEEQGPDPAGWAWGRFHQLTFHHVMGRQKPLDEVFSRGPYPIGGDGDTIWASTSMMDRLDASAGVVGPPFRFIADLADLDHSQGLLVPGQSGQVGSPHYDDQIEDWFAGGYHRMLFHREDVLQGQAFVLDLLPAL